MNLLHLSLLSGQHIGLFFGLGGMALGLIFGLAGMYLGHRRRVMWHELAKLAIEKGQPLPPHDAETWSGELQPGNAQARWRGYLIGGLINLGVGIGLFFALSRIPGTAFNVGYFGCIPGCIGLALLLGAVVEAVASRKQ